MELLMLSTIHYLQLSMDRHPKVLITFYLALKKDIEDKTKLRFGLFPLSENKKKIKKYSETKRIYWLINLSLDMEAQTMEIWPGIASDIINTLFQVDK